MKRIWIIFLVIVLLFTALPVCVLAEETEATLLEAEIIKEARDTYLKAQRFAGKRSFHGKCGLFVGTQLRCLGINTKRLSFDGNDTYDYYEGLEVTSGGYYVVPYASESYDLLGALQAVSDHGKKNVRNVLVGFQWTNTDAGRKFGHAMFINGIVNGNVYFTESFNSALGGPEGTVIKCSMEDFAKSYNKWTEFDGIIHFGVGDYYDVCLTKSTDLTLQARFDTSLRSQPALVGEKKCEVIKDIAAGDIFRATAIYGFGRALYYKVETESGFGFVPCNAMGVVKVNEAGIALSGAKLFGTLKAGEKAKFSGTVTDTTGVIDSLEIHITDAKGEIVRNDIVAVSGTSAKLSSLGKNLYLDLLEPGNYQVEIFVTRTCPTVVAGLEGEASVRMPLKGYLLQVGK